MNILITGGAGFIGSAVVRKAIADGHSVINLDCLTYAACLDNVKSIENRSEYSFVQGDIGSRSLVEEVFEKFSPDCVLNLAAETHVDRSIDAPHDFLNTNVLGTLNLLEVSRNYWYSRGKPTSFRFHHVSTDEVYGSLPYDRDIRFTEDTPYSPRSPYAASKASSDHLVKSWYHTYGMPILLTNCSNNYGPFHFPEKLIPTVILNALKEQALPIYGDGSNVRDWLYVDDHAAALLLVLEKGQVGRSYNIGGDCESTNLDLVKTLCQIMDELHPRANSSYTELISFVTDRPGHDARYSIDPTRIRTELGWQPRVDLKTGLRLTVQWYLDNSEWWGPLLERHDISERLGKKI